MRRLTISILFVLLASAIVQAQEGASLYDKTFAMPDKFFSGIDKKSQKLQQQMTRATYKYLAKLEKRELKMKKQLQKKDSSAAENLFGDTKAKYAAMRQAIDNPSDKLQQVYSPFIDSMKTGLGFLNKNNLLADEKLNKVYAGYGAAQNKFNQTEFISQQLKEREQFIKEKLQNFGLVKEFNQFRAQVYYYRAQAEEYRRIFENPQKLEATLMNVVSKIPAFSKFFAQHSELASMFRLPGNDDISTAQLNDMQTRDMLMQQMQERLGTGTNVQQYANANIANGQSALQSAKDKLKQIGESGNDSEIPGFKPNNQKSKSFLNRLEIGTNVQNQKSDYFFPTTTDLGLSIGYKLNSKSVIGIGTSYKIGWGRDIRHIRVTAEGSSIRSFLDWKLKGSFYVTGGYEFNYQTAWTNSALLGISKIININNKYFKKTKAQLLWDFLSYQQRPVTPALKFRIGYTLK